ncbi:hypothetical protein M8C21_000679, partial [Ambrosia artemisiifolia]
MAYEPSTINNMQQTYTTDETPAYTPMLPPTSSPYNNNNPNCDGVSLGDGESDYALTAAGIDVSGGDVVKRKRGRPRKNPTDGCDGPLAMVATAAQSGEPNLGKKSRGRPPGSTKKLQPVASGSPGGGFMPHVVDVKSGEDVLAKLIWLSQNSTRALCILSASGVISNVTLELAATSTGTATYEGQFEILSLSGSFIVPESDNQHSRICGLSVALSGPNGRVLGGNVAGPLTAASPVQVIIGSFVPTSRKPTNERAGSEAEVVNDSANPLSGSLSESSGGVLGSPVGQSYNNNQQGIVDML